MWSRVWFVTLMSPAMIQRGAFTIAFAIGGYWYTLGPPESSGSWLTDEERRFLVLRKRYENGPSPVSAHWTWHAVKQAAMGEFVEMASNKRLVGSGLAAAMRRDKPTHRQQTSILRSTSAADH